MTSNYQYNFTKKVETDLDEILSYISIELSNPDAAASFLKDLEAVIASIVLCLRLAELWIMNSSLIEKYESLLWETTSYTIFLI